MSLQGTFGGPLSRLRNGDRIKINAKRGLLSVSGLRKGNKTAAKRKILSGVLEKYAAQVGSAFRGAVTHGGPKRRPG